MSKRWKTKVAAVAAGVSGLLAVNAPFAAAADIWSQPTYTEQWSTPTYTEQWSVPAATDPWSDNPPAAAESEPAAAAAAPAAEPASAPAAEPASAPATEPAAAARQQSSLYVKLQLDSNRAFIQNEERLIDVPPIRINGRTMVPFRFLSELMKADVGWDPATQVITFNSGETTVLLKVGQSTAMVNGSPVILDAPPVLSRGRTLVPLRFLAESMNLQVQYTEATQTIEIRNRGAAESSGIPETASGPAGAGAANGANSANIPNAGSSGNTGSSGNAANSGNSGNTGNAGNAGGAADSSLDVLTNFEALYGDWLIWTPGGATNLYFKDTGNYATHEYTPGAEQGTISINKDGTFTMNYAIWGEASGKWRLTYPAEINGERLIGIVLPNGAGGYDWAVAPSANGTVRLLSSAGTWADGSSSWIIESELYRK